MKSITLNLDKSVPYHLTTYSIFGKISRAFGLKQINSYPIPETTIVED